MVSCRYGYGGAKPMNLLEGNKNRQLILEKRDVLVQTSCYMFDQINLWL